MLPSVQRLARLVNIVGSHDQFGPTDRWIHTPGIVGSDHGLNPDLIQDAFGDLGIRCGPERRNDNEV